jgi:DNA-binding transcriptional regulator LsrR (DeoR family)
MPQAFFPIFAEAVVHINSNLAYKKEGERIYYFNGHQMPVFSHDETDIQSFRMIVSQFYVNGNATQSEIVKTFGLPPITMKRAVKLFREKGPAGFYISAQPERKPRVLTSEVVMKLQALLDEGVDLKEAAVKAGVKLDTLQKAVRDGRVKKKSMTQS